MAVAYDSQADRSRNGSNSYTVALSTSGTDRVIIAETHTSNNEDLTPSASGLTFVQIGSDLSFAGNGRMKIWRAFASSKLTALTVTLTSTNFPQSHACITTWSGADTTGTNGSGAIGATNTVTSGGATSSSAAITTTIGNAQVIGLFAETEAKSVSAGSNQTVKSYSTTEALSRGVIIQRNSLTTTSGTSVTGNVTWSGSVASGGMTLEIKPPAVTSIPHKIYKYMQAVNRAARY